MLDKNVTAIGWDELNLDLAKLHEKRELETRYNAAYPDRKGSMKANVHVNEIWRFVHDVKQGDIVVLPMKTESGIAVGEIESAYEYRTDLGPDMQHTRRVKWIQKMLPRTRFEQDLLFSFGSLLTICQVSRNDAEKRVRTIIRSDSISTGRNGETETDAEVDVEQIAKDRVRAHIQTKFKGHELARLVEAVLISEGFYTRLSPPGPDGGVDILAGKGSRGLDSPKICVQVKSSDAAIDIHPYRELVAALQKSGADHGLLISWGGFKANVRKEADDYFFRIRLWDSDELLGAIFKNYDNLPETIRAELPLKKIWTLASPEEEE